MADAEKLFVPFKRLPGTTEFIGHGIGLATVERIIRRHDGKVWAEGVPGRGAIFYFTLHP
jgi:signal transduction histidine kinase